MQFISTEHEIFYREQLQKAKIKDVYHQSLIYTLGINDDTRSHISQIFDFNTDCIKPECIYDGWQTSGSLRVTRLAFNLYCNGTPTADEETLKQNELIRELRSYSVEDIFCCGYTPFFGQSIQIRYPEYTKYDDSF